MRYKNELEIDVGRCFRELRKRWKFIFLLTALFAILGVCLTLEAGEDLYQSSATVYSGATGSYQTSMTGISAMNDYSELCTSYKVCERAALLMGYDDIDGKMVMNSIWVTLSSSSSGVASSYFKSDAGLIKIYAQTNNPTISMEMAKAVADSFVMEMENIVGADVVKLLDSPYDYSMSRNAKKACWKKRIIVTMAGAFIGCFIVVFFEIFGSKTRTIRECSIRNELPIIGVIPDFKD